MVTNLILMVYVIFKLMVNTEIVSIISTTSLSDKLRTEFPLQQSSDLSCQMAKETRLSVAKEIHPSDALLYSSFYFLLLSFSGHQMKCTDI